jgi:hypothetical protein
MLSNPMHSFIAQEENTGTQIPACLDAAGRSSRRDLRRMASRKTAPYEIETYHEKFIDEQARIGTEATKDWKAYRQTPAEELRKTYSGADFDPSTRFYALLNGELIGFLTSSVVGGIGEKTAIMRLPLVKKGHEPAEKALMDHALKVLRDKRVLLLTTEVAKGWGAWEALLKKYKFEDIGAASYIVDKTISSLNLSALPAPTGVVEYERGWDREAFCTMLTATGMPAERTKVLVDQYESGAKGSYFRRIAVVRKENKTIAASALTVPDNEPDIARIMRIMMIPGVDLSDVGGRIIRKLIEAGAKDGLKRFRLTLMPDNLREYNAILTRLKVEAVPFVHTYRKSL